MDGSLILKLILKEREGVHWVCLTYVRLTLPSSAILVQSCLKHYVPVIAHNAQLPNSGKLRGNCSSHSCTGGSTARIEECGESTGNRGPGGGVIWE